MAIRKLILAILISFFLTIPAMAAWTVTAAYCDGSPYSWGSNTYLFCFDISVLSDAGSSGDQVLSTLLTTAYGKKESDRLMRSIEGAALYWVDYTPGAVTPTTESTITIDKENGYLFFSEAVTTAATAQGWKGDTDTGRLMPLTEVTLAMTTLANAKNATIRLWFYGGRK